MLAGSDSGWVHQISEVWPVAISLIGALLWLGRLVVGTQKNDKEVISLSVTSKIQTETMADQEKRIGLLEDRYLALCERAGINTDRLDDVEKSDQEAHKELNYLRGRMDRGAKRASE